jgi:hypothetical protein
MSDHRLSALLTFAPPDAFPKYRYLTGRPTHLAGLPLVSPTRGILLAIIYYTIPHPFCNPFGTKTPGAVAKSLDTVMQGDVPDYVKSEGLAGQHLNTRIAPGDNDRVSIGAAILILNRSSFAEDLLTKAERARSGDLCPSQSKLEP